MREKSDARSDWDDRSHCGDRGDFECHDHDHAVVGGAEADDGHDRRLMDWARDRAGDHRHLYLAGDPGAAVARNFYANRGAVLAWNILGTLDLVTAVSLGVLSAPGSPLQVVGETIGSTAMWSLPWSNIPTLLVPFYFITHGIIFARLAGANRVTANQLAERI
jgi:hypothetical protein